MAQEYLPAPSNVRLADLMKEHNISQPELAKEIGCSKSTISRFISGAKGTLTHEQVLRIARLFNVSTDFLLGETNIPDRKNYDIAELGLSVEAAKNLYTGRIEAIADPYAMQPQSIMEEQESRRELYYGLKRLTQREQTYLLYRYGFTDGEEHLLIGTAIYFHLTKGRAKKTEEQAMDNLWLELPWWFD